MCERNTSPLPRVTTFPLLWQESYFRNEYFGIGRIRKIIESNGSSVD